MCCYFGQINDIDRLYLAVKARLSNCQSSDTLLMDMPDGNYLSTHPFLHDHPSALLFALYTDDFELVNPIGSHRKKHKVSVFYWTLLNIPVEYRSRLSAIQLLALA